MATSIRPIPKNADAVTPGSDHGFAAVRAYGRRLVVWRVVGDGLTLAAAVALAWGARFGLGLLAMTEDAPLDIGAHAIVGGSWIAGLVLLMSSHRLYDEDTLAAPGAEVRRVRTAVLEGTAAVSTAVFFLRLITVSRGWFLLVAVGSFAGLVAERAILRRVIRRARVHGHLRRPVVLVGGDGHAFASDEFDVVATLPVGDLATYLRHASERRRRWGVEMPGVVLQADTRPSEETWDLVVRAGGAGLAAYVVSPVRSVAADRLTAREIDGRTIVKVSPPALTGFRAVEKRAFDAIVATAALVLLALPMAVIAAAIFVTSGRPVLYGQERVGRNGRRFRMWKFRSMVVDAERDTGPVWASADDPRRTRFGRFLRTSSLDELPQLWNVLTGEMSIVGPRPERPPFVDGFSERLSEYAHRHRIKPGITGLAQVRGLRGGTDLGPRVDADNRYIEHWSLLLDVAISFRTLVEVIRHRNAG